jgi:hypothetical protein
MTIRRVISVLIGALAVGALAATFTIIGSPAHQRRLGLDLATMSDLLALANEQRRPAGDPLPRKPRQGTTDDGRTLDPATYDYRRLSDERFELCASFLEPSERDAFHANVKDPAGRTCFRFDAADPTAPIGSTSRR